MKGRYRMVIHILTVGEKPKEGSRVSTNCGHNVRFVHFEVPWNDRRVCKKCLEIQRSMSSAQPEPLNVFTVVDGNFVCGGCGGIMVKVRRQPDGRKVFNCEKCHNNECLECTVCHYPRSIWADDGNVCGVCALDMMEGKRELTQAHMDDIKKWTVKVPSVPPFSQN